MSDADILENYMTSVALGVALFALCAVVVRRINTPGPAVYLEAAAVFLFIQALDLADDLIFDSPLYAPATLVGWQDGLLPLFMISIWFFVRGLTEPVMRLRPKDMWHALPLVLAYLLLLPMQTLPLEMREDILSDPDPNSLHHMLAVLGAIGLWVEWIVLLVAYGFACARRLTRHKRRIRTLFSDLSGKSLWWLDALVAAILLLSWVVIFDEGLDIAGVEPFLMGVREGLYEISIGLIIGLFALSVTPPLPDWSADVPTQEVASSGNVETGAIKEDRYARSGLSRDDLKRMAARITARMEAGELWRDPMLNLKSLADAASIAPMHVSEVLNIELGESFFEHVNKRRIKDACHQLRTSDASVLEISEAVGYNSKSTFNANFKRLMGQTPSEWRKSSTAEPTEV